MTCVLKLCCDLLRQLIEHLLPSAILKGHMLLDLSTLPTPCSTHDCRLYTPT